MSTVGFHQSVSYQAAKCKNSRNFGNYISSASLFSTNMTSMTYRVSQKWNGFSCSLVWIWGSVCEICHGSIVFAHCSRFATGCISAQCHLHGYIDIDQTLCILFKMTQGTYELRRAMLYIIVVTLVNWKLSCRPVNVASIDWGAISIWQIPGKEHNVEQECASLPPET